LTGRPHLEPIDTAAKQVSMPTPVVPRKIPGERGHAV
jgi:hypothetical protein